jgi:hypothetical protein
MRIGRLDIRKSDFIELGSGEISINIFVFDP